MTDKSLDTSQEGGKESSAEGLCLCLYLNENGFEGVSWIQLAQDRDQWGTF